MINKIFILNNNQSWIKIIFWWEIRRILYNFLLILFGILSLTVLSFLIRDIWSFISPPIFFFIWIGVFLLIANIFYTSGWIFQIITLKSSNKFISRIKPKIFIYGILFSFIIELIPVFIASGYFLVKGERIKSQYADFTKIKPEIKDIVGNYLISEISKKQLNFPDSISNKTIINFNSDMSFEFKYFLYHNGLNFRDYDIVNTKGNWKIYKDHYTWVISMHFDSIVNSYTEQLIKKNYHVFNSYHINNDKPPYEIYITVGDPDSWQVIKLHKIEE